MFRINEGFKTFAKKKKKKKSDVLVRVWTIKCCVRVCGPMIINWEVLC